MAYTLISMVGTGMYRTQGNSEGYLETDYYFDVNTHFKTRLFMEAMLQWKAKQIDQIILLGTDTSSWDCLVDKENDERDETIELWDSLFDQCESKQKGVLPSGVSRGNLDRLEAYLTERFGKEVKIRMHSHTIDDSSSKELFDCYMDATALVKAGNDILFDITHGFRSMPVLLYQSLQYSAGQHEGHSIEIIYGELDSNDRSRAKARNLSSYWRYSELTKAMHLFSSKLDGFRLAELIAKDWEKGSKAIKKLSEIVQTNFALQIFDVARQVRNALAVYPVDAPAWLGKVKAELETIASIIDEVDKATSLLRYSEYLYARKLNVQAVITLQVAVETAVVMKYGSEDKLGDYDWWQSNGKEILRQMKGENWKEMGNPLKNLERFRNQVAHGGGMDSYTKAYPQAANIPAIYENGRRGVKQLLTLLAGD